MRAPAFWIDAHQTVGEFDGKVKYGRALYEQSGQVTPPVPAAPTATNTLLPW